MSSLCLTNFPADVHVLIGGFLKPSEMEGMIVASKYMREQYAKSYFHDVTFRGTNMDLVLALTAFIHARHYQATTSTIVLPAIKHVTIELEDDETSPGPHAAFVLPRLVASSLGAMRNLQGINIDLWWLSDVQRQELRDRCAGLPVWNGLRSIQMEDGVDTELLAILVSKSRPESFSGLQFEGQLELQAARQCTPFLRRLAVPFRLPASKNVGGRARVAGFVSNQTGVLTQFGRLEWLVLAPTQVKPGAVGVIREDPKLFVKVLVKELSRLGYLERLGLTFPRSILVEHQPGVPGTGTGLPAVEHYVRQWNEQIFATIPALQQVAFIHGDIVLKAPLVISARSRQKTYQDRKVFFFPFAVYRPFSPPFLSNLDTTLAKITVREWKEHLPWDSDLTRTSSHRPYY
ncbi:hypothetical protein FNAPI_684 [Fusarium napiforme]|uniref:F-box domain-containing protein n=1 Tax=Fusarium napiforme TaxID=42672 RepID=A0A8H5K862_9HYPO|nr:hypothetical protein FNAPI_684 [Fusarium napiforme]